VLLTQRPLPQHHCVRVGNRRERVVQDDFVERHRLEFIGCAKKGAATMFCRGTRLARGYSSGSAHVVDEYVVSPVIAKNVVPFGPDPENKLPVRVE